MAKIKKASKPAKAKLTTIAKRNWLPALVAVFLTVLILGVLNFEWFLAQWRFQFTKRIDVPVVVVQPPELKPDPTAPSKISIPVINVDAPIIFDEPSMVHWKVQLALRRGVVHYGPTVMPGQNGMMALAGHSSGAAWAPGNYKWVFTLLEKMEPGDQIKISYQGIDFVYEVTDKVVVSPSAVDALPKTENATLSLVTCTPVGTDKNRLIVRAKLVSPTVEAAAILYR